MLLLSYYLILHFLDLIKRDEKKGNTNKLISGNQKKKKKKKNMANWTGTEKWVQVLNGLRTTWISDYKTPSWSLVSEIL